MFLFLLLGATIESFWNPKFISKKTILISLCIILFIIFEFHLFGGQSLFGLGEKQHGSLFFAGLIWFGYLCTYIGKNERYLYISTIIFTALCIAGIALIEFIFRYNFFIGGSLGDSGSWGSGRSTATLGNPNYLAGYLLMVVPMVGFMKNNWKKYASALFLFLGILSTGSFIGITLALLFFLFLLLRKLYKKKGTLLFIGTSTILIISILALFYGDEKWLSFTSRFVLMQETLFSMSNTWFSFIFGNGPNALIEYYEGIRSPLIESYFPSNMIIDSSHNITIDVLKKFGIMGIGLLSFLVISKWKRIETPLQYSIIIGFCFFSLNVPIVSVYLLFIFCLTQELREL